MAWYDRMLCGLLCTALAMGLFPAVSRAQTAPVVSVKANEPVSGVGEKNGYSIVLENGNQFPIEIDEIADELDPGFSYLPGSTHDATIADPTVSGQTLTWTGSFIIPASGSIALRFGVVVPSVPGDYLNQAKACYTDTATGGLICVQSRPTAQITVVREDLEITKTADEAVSFVGEENGYTITITNPNAIDQTVHTIGDTLPAGFSYVSGSTSGVTSSDPAVESSLTWLGQFNVPAGGSITLHFDVVVASVPGVYLNMAYFCISRDCVTTGETAPVDVRTRHLTTSKLADLPEVFVGEQDGYTIEISNANAVEVTLTGIFDTLPAGFSYVAGSTTGVTSSDPSGSGQTLTWSGPFTIPAQSSIGLHFNVIVASIPGTYLNEAGGTIGEESGFTVRPTGPTAPIVVRALSLVTTKTADAPKTNAGEFNGYTITIGNPNGVPVTLDEITDTLPPDFTYMNGSTTGVTTTHPQISGSTLTWSGPFSVPAHGSISLHFHVFVADDGGTYFNRAGGSASAGFDVKPTGLTAPIRVIGRSVLVAHPAIAELLPGARIRFPQLSATLSEEGGPRPLAGRRIVFTAGEVELCRADTDIHGVASCGGLIEEIEAVLALGYEAHFTGDDDYQPADDDGALLSLNGDELP